MAYAVAFTGGAEMPKPVRKVLLGVLPLLAMSVSGWAQMTPTAACPVNLSAERLPIGQQVQVTRSMDAPGFGVATPGIDVQKVVLRLSYGQDAVGKTAIQSVSGTVYGISATGQFVPAGSGRKPDRHAPFVLHFHASPKGNEAPSWSSEVGMSAVTAVTKVVVTSITYGDGTTWKAADPSTCTVEPNALLPIARN